MALITLATGKVEFGQGIQTGFAQLAAEELDVPFARVTAVMGQTNRDALAPPRRSAARARGAPARSCGRRRRRCINGCSNSARSNSASRSRS